MQKARLRIQVLLFLLCMMFTCTSPIAQAAPEQPLNVPPVQMFDMKQERIIKSVPNQEKYQQYAEQWLKSITKVAPQVSIGTKCGYIVRVPLAKPFTVNVPNLQVETNTVFLIYCPEKEPLLLVFGPDRKPYLMEFKADVKPFIEEMLTPSHPGANRQ
ncbi:type IV secretion system protein VirB6 [Paenibacillus aquistagni]|uniref:type IV secretion system protein VirB6 n=1 Tax=Paenibacillus aquistagni TaxID=1852522 RepID=UPI000B50EC9B|nr:type IV secretion system protein VirB6 [Paenibacillus aquistagni]NMM54193.1 type IV secretion system protein VirB6 [Paenibacillus aquistagni]